MAHGPARIDSPDVLRELRAQFAKFDEACRQSLAACDAHVKTTDAWLANDQRIYLKQLLRKCDEAVLSAQRDYAKARWSATDLSRSSGVEEKRVLDRAKRKKEEVEEKVAALEKWTIRLEDAVDKMRKPLIALGNLLDFTTPRALARIDQMIDSLEEYLRPPPAPEGDA